MVIYMTFLGWGMATEKQLANLTNAGAFKRNTRETQQKIARMGAEASNRKQAEKKNLIQLFEICQQAKITDEKMAQKLREAGLPETYAGQMAFSVIQKAGTNPMMLRTLLEATGMLKPQNNVTVNAVPIIIGGEDELK